MQVIDAGDVGARFIESGLQLQEGKKEGLHAILYVINGNARYTVEQQKTFENIARNMDLWPYVIVVISHASILGSDIESQKTKIRTASEDLRQLKWLFTKTDGRYVPIDSITTSKTYRQQRIRDLLLYVKDIERKQSGLLYQGANSSFPCYSIILIGEGGAGKSSLGNFFLAKNCFEIATGMLSGTDNAEQHSTIRNGAILKVIDCPGFGNPDKKPISILKEGLQLASTNSIKGVDKVLLVLSAESRFTIEQQMVLEGLNQEKFFWSNVIAVITHSNSLGRDNDDQRKAFQLSLEKPDCPASFKWLMKKICQRFIVIDTSNNQEEYREKKRLELFQHLQSTSAKRLTLQTFSSDFSQSR